MEFISEKIVERVEDEDFGEDYEILDEYDNNEDKSKYFLINAKLIF
jgi:hypothetical protein